VCGGVRADEIREPCERIRLDQNRVAEDVDGRHVTCGVTR
jgi:hypothetical protein